MGYKRGDRMRLQNSLSSRDRRRMFTALTEAQLAVERAEEARDKLMGEYWTKGLPQAGLQGATGLGYATVQEALREQGCDIDPE